MNHYSFIRFNSMFSDSPTVSTSEILESMQTQETVLYQTAKGKFGAGEKVPSDGVVYSLESKSKVITQGLNEVITVANLVKKHSF